MKMKVASILLYLVFRCSPGLTADNEFGVKKGSYPYMALIYYLDPSIVDVSGARFVRSAVLVRAQWLLSSALGPSVVGSVSGFPRKTLLARVGALTLDRNFTFNEDEDEQEGEIIQVIRPLKMSVTQWWTTDISLLKTLIPFNLSLAVDPKPLRFDINYPLKDCFILVYAKKNSSDSEEKSLAAVSVEMLEPSLGTCGAHWAAGTMTCARPATTDTQLDDNFCVGNSGGPLVCGGEVRGLQTYIDGQCAPPHLYQLVSAWESFVTCGVYDRCDTDNCSNVCDVILKDMPVPHAAVAPPPAPEERANTTASTDTTTETETLETTQHTTPDTTVNGTSTAVNVTDTATTGNDTTTEPVPPAPRVELVAVSPTNTAASNVSTSSAPAMATGGVNATRWPKVRAGNWSGGADEDEEDVGVTRRVLVKRLQQYRAPPVHRTAAAGAEPPAPRAPSTPRTLLLTCLAILGHNFSL